MDINQTSLRNHFLCEFNVPFPKLQCSPCLQSIEKSQQESNEKGFRNKRRRKTMMQRALSSYTSRQPELSCHADGVTYHCRLTHCNNTRRNIA
mmetsp:Transcript_37688/g.53151  ORF Transcript_37688/g.53151 Transcript_37688/m.53151 type:complete len:93 (-) Transcript_37688:112-390(-)